MNEREFKEWLAYHCTDLFPSVGEWFARLDDDGIGDGVRKTWLGVLSPVEYQDAIAVSKGMATGIYKVPSAYERDTTPATIRQIAFRIKEQREGSGPEPGQRPRKREDFNPMMGRVFKGMASMRKEGRSEQEIQEWAMESLAKSATPEDPRNAYKCLACSDTGWVLVWAPQAHRNAVTGYLDELRDRPTCAMACRCDRGQRHQSNHNRLHTNQNITFDHQKHIRTTGVSDARAIQELKTWAQQVIDGRHENEEASLL